MSGPVQLTPREQAILQRKFALAQEYALVRAGKFSFATYKQDYLAFVHQYGGTNAQEPTFVATPATCCSSNHVPWVQSPQHKDYYCGPATAYEILVSYGKYIHPNGDTLSQETLAGSRYLNTDDPRYLSTPWNPYVMGPTLNAWVGWTFYVAVNGSGVGGGFSVDTWKYSLTEDIDHGWPLAGNVVERAGPNHPHLVGHTTAVDVYHWIAIEGYASSGDTTWYADSVSGTHFWTWAANVPPFSGIPSTNMTTLLNERGYIW